MLADRIIGRVGANVLKARVRDIGAGGASDSTARFRLDRLSPNQIAAVVREVVADAELSGLVDVKIPESLVAHLVMPLGTVISGNAGLGRNADTDRAVLLTANGDEPAIADTVAYVTALGAKEFKASGEAWAEATTKVVGVPLVSEDARVFRAALNGLFQSIELSLMQAGEFCSMVAEAATSQGLPIREAVGWSLPRVGLPRDTSLFSNTKSYAAAATPWRRAFDKLVADRQPLLAKLRKNGQPIDQSELEERYEAALPEITEHARDVILSFIKARPGDELPAKELALLEWEADGVHMLFDRPKAKQQGLAQDTLTFFDDDQPDVLDKRWKTHLEDLKAREKRQEWNAEDEEFFELHRHFLEANPVLRGRWEKVVFGKSVECTDFLEGLTTVTQRLVAASEASKGDRLLRVRLRRSRKEWRVNFNHDAGAFFSVMYRGLAELLGERVEWKVEGQRSNPSSPLFDYPGFFTHEKATDRTGKVKECTSESRAALQIKFEVSLVERVGSVETSLRKTQMVWTAKPTAIGFALREDIQRLLEKGGCACTDVPRRLVSAKGGTQSVSLLDVNTLEATFGRDAGSLVPPANRMKSLRHEIKQVIDELRKDGRYTADQRDVIRAAWDNFEAAYIEALRDVVERGLHADSILLQAEAFGALLRVLLTHARGDLCRSRLVAKVLSVGTCLLSGDTPAVIIPPWHPERLKALAVKTRRAAGLIGHMLTGENVTFGDRNIFFQEFNGEMEHPFYPEIAVAGHGGGLTLVAETATMNGYSLMEPPSRGEDRFQTDVLPSAAAKEIRELVERYISLQPHEADNLSILLYDADAAALPLAAVRELAEMQSEANLQVAVSHRDPVKQRAIYAELVSRADSDLDAPIVSETAENFMSKLRVSVSPLQSNPPRSTDGFKPFDIAFLHDVVARTASIEWLPVEWAVDQPDLEHAPSRWSYRAVSGEDELKAAAFLACPRQTRSGGSWVDAVSAVVRQSDHVEGRRVVPARRISLQDLRLKAVLDEVHALAEWVATHDELLDKRQLRANNIKVVRYRHQRTNGRNMIVSSTSDLRLLDVLIRRRIYELGLSLTDAETGDMARRLVEDALSVSGDIVLRAAKRGVSAGELIGLTLSRFIVEREFRKICGDGSRPRLVVFFLLDDYAAWLAQRENRLADLLGLCVEEDGGAMCLHVAVIEAKYVGAAGSAEARRSSKAQLVATLSTFDDALFGDPGRLDRDIWLSRLSDLLLDAVVPPGSTGLLERARAAIRDGMARISMRGYSHVFVHSAEPDGNSPGSLRVPVESRSMSPAYQEVFDRPELRRLAEAYARHEDTTPIREAIGHDVPWLVVETRLPARRTSWTEMLGRLVPSPATPEDVSCVPVADDREEGHVAVAVGHHPLPAPEIPRDSQPEPAAFPGTSDMGGLYGPTLSALVTAKAARLTAAGGGRDEWAASLTTKLKSALNGYGLQAQVLGTRLTPNGCLVRFAGSDRLRTEDIESRRTQLLTTHGIRLVTIQPKPGEIVVTLAGETRRAVSLWDTWATREINRNVAGINTSFILGLQELNGFILYLNLGSDFGGLTQHEPHSLVAGTTGSGKSVLVQAVLLDIAATNPSNLAKIILIDPKMGVDYTALDTLPHLREPIIIDKQRATEVLASVVDEMEARYRAFAAARVRDLASFNAKVAQDERIPMLFLVHDEFADWMLDDEYKTAVGRAVQRLGIKARAAGIHLFFAAQRPDKDVMPMQLRDNLGNRLILKVASEATSKIVLDRPGAEQLLGRGHLAARLSGEQGLVYAQAPFLSDADIAEAVEAIIADDVAVSAC